MAGMRKLSDITLFRFAGLALLMIAVSLPLAYQATWHIYLDEVDEALLKKTAGFMEKHGSRFTADDIVAWNDYLPDMQITRAMPGDTIARWSDEMVFDSIGREQEPCRILRTPLPGLADGQYTLVTRSSVLETEDLVLALMLLYGTLAGLLLLGWLLLTRGVNKRLWRPFYDTLAKIRRFNLEHGEIPSFPPAQVLEFQQLNAAVAELAESNLRSWNQQKEFFENASHELQTPLAVMRAQLDLLAQDESLTEAQSRSVDTLTQSFGRLARLNRNLLLLSKIDNGLYAEAKETDLAENLRRQLDFLQPLAEASNIHLKINSLESVPVLANTILLDTLLSNLLTNALRHTAPGGTVEVTLATGKLDIANSGAGPLDTERLFRRFAPGRSEEQGSGLGLAIAQRAAAASGWTLAYRWENGRHIFEWRF